MEIPPFIYDFLRNIAIFALGTTVALTASMSALYLIRRRSDNRWANLLFSLLLAAFALTLLDNLIAFTGFGQRHLRIASLPFYTSFAIAPLIFFYTKARLYPHFELSRRDFKHIILPITQFVLLSWVFLQGTETSIYFRTNFFNPFYGNLEKLIFILQFFSYLYFSYTFILHERQKFQTKTFLENTSNRAFRKHFLVLGWLKRFTKTLVILFAVYTFFIATDYIFLRFLDTNLQNKLLFSIAYEFSFAAMPVWTSLNAFFAWRRSL